MPKLNPHTRQLAIEVQLKTGLLVLGNQLFGVEKLTHAKFDAVFMREDAELCTYYKFHKLKIVFFLSAMRSYAEELRNAGHSVTYEELKVSSEPYETHLKAWLRKNSIKKILCHEIEDKFYEIRIHTALKDAGVEVETLQSPMFLTTRAGFKTYLSKGKRPFMKTFYESQRKRLKILVDSENEPIGGQWSFDELNRKPLPKTVHPPEPIRSSVSPAKNEIIKKVSATCEKHFANHPGELSNIWFPVDREGAREWLTDFVENRLDQFGPYEDALTNRSDFVFHSALTPFLNTGLLTPEDVIRTVLKSAKENKIEIASVEGFIRQVIGCRG